MIGKWIDLWVTSASEMPKSRDMKQKIGANIRSADEDGKRNRGISREQGMNENHDYRDFSTPRPREARGGSRYFFFGLTRSFKKRKRIKWDISGKRCQIVNACNELRTEELVGSRPKELLDTFFSDFRFFVRADQETDNQGTFSTCNRNRRGRNVIANGTKKR